jgi:hypothetical protein
MVLTSILRHGEISNQPNFPIMFRFSRKVLDALTFPGIVVHQGGRKLMCHAMGAEVNEVCWFQWEHPMGYVVHEDPDAVWKQYVIGLGPVFVNLAGAILLALMALPFAPKGNDVSLPNILLCWLGISVAVHAFPNRTDAGSIWALAWESEEAPVWTRVLSVPVVGLVYLFTLNRFLGLDFVFGVLLVLLTQGLANGSLR